MATTVLISAPYFLKAFDEFKGMLHGAKVDWVLAEVEERLNEQELLKYAGQYDGAICGDDQYTEEVLRASQPRLKVLSKWGTGIDSINAEAAKALGVAVYNTPEAFTQAVADTVLAYILAFARRGPWLDRAIKSGKWEKLPSIALHECTVGVIGVGSIGKAVLKRAHVFGMKLLGNDIVEIDAEFLGEIPVKMVELDELLREADFISLNCDLNPSSLRLIGQNQFAVMKSSAVLVNTARGQVIDESALVEALHDKRIAGAALDVFEVEPLPADSPLRSMDHVMLAPHNANSSPEAWGRVHRNTLRNLFTGLDLPIPEELREPE
jgi:D-3-phosphoglycerate dehydrogenase